MNECMKSVKFQRGISPSGNRETLSARVIKSFKVVLWKFNEQTTWKTTSQERQTICQLKSFLAEQTSAAKFVEEKFDFRDFYVN